MTWILVVKTGLKFKILTIFGHLKISFEIQPSLPQGQLKIASNGQIQQPKIITQQPRASDSQVFFCCTSTEKSVKLREDQFDFCPQNWFQDLGNSPTTCKKFKRFLWRLSFLFTCLPLCYPCYLSRTVRRRPKHLPKQRQTEFNFDYSRKDQQKQIESNITYCLKFKFKLGVV